MHDPTAVHPQQLPGDGRVTSTSLSLLERARDRDDDAWRHLVTLYTPLVRHWCRRWGVADGDDVNDILQEVFQAIFCGLKTFRRDREGDSFRAWLHGVTRNKCLILFRYRDPSRSPGGTDFYRRSLLVPERPGTAPDHEQEQLVGALYQDALRLVRDEFEGRTWQAFWRATVEGQASSHIAEDLGMTPAAVRQAKSRVLRRLKAVLGETGGA